MTYRNKTFYVAGPMRHRPYYNDDAFYMYAKIMRGKYPDTTFISPAEMDIESGIVFSDYPEGTEPLKTGDTLSDLMRRDLDAIDGCNGVIVLPGWEFSTGAAVEVAYAKFLSLPVFHVEEFL